MISYSLVADLGADGIVVLRLSRFAGVARRRSACGKCCDVVPQALIQFVGLTQCTKGMREGRGRQRAEQEGGWGGESYAEEHKDFYASPFRKRGRVISIVGDREEVKWQFSFCWRCSTS